MDHANVCRRPVRGVGMPRVLERCPSSVFDRDYLALVGQKLALSGHLVAAKPRISPYYLACGYRRQWLQPRRLLYFFMFALCFDLIGRFSELLGCWLARNPSFILFALGCIPLAARDHTNGKDLVEKGTL